MSRPGLRSVVRNATFIFGSHATTTVLRLGYTMALALGLGPVLYGQFNYGLAWYQTLLPLTLLGLPLLLSREIGADRSKAGKLIPQTETDPDADEDAVLFRLRAGGAQGGRGRLDDLSHALESAR